jgi:hypothetical protein
MTKKEIAVKYTARGFSQDAEQAMRGDVVRGLIELITNCDDAYGSKPGTIRIVVTRPSDPKDFVEVAVSDSAKGLTPAEMEKAFTHLGAELSGFANGENVRGLFGRGSKDTAWFGRTVFEAIKNGVFSVIFLNRDGKGTFENRVATTDDYARLGLKQGDNGLTARMQVDPKRAKVPDLAKLTDRLSRHVQLRQLNTKNEVLIAEVKNGLMVKQTPVVWELPTNEEIFNEEIQISAYNTTAKLRISKFAQRINEPVSDYSYHGIEIRGSRASYMNTSFGLAGAGVGFITGLVECPKIDELIRQYDLDEAAGKPNSSNPVRMITRDRNGLADDHPFVRALTVAVLEKLKPIVDSLEPKQADLGGTELKKNLDRLARMLGELMKQDLDEDDDDEGIVGNLPTLDRPIVVIPPVSQGAVGSNRTLSILIHKNFADSGITLKLSNENCEVITTPTQPISHTIFENVMIANARLSLKIVGSTRVTISTKSDESVFGIADILVHNDPTPEENPPAELMWKNAAMSVTVGKSRTVTLIAPIEAAPKGTLNAQLTIEGDSVSVLQNETTLSLNNKGWLSGKVKVQGVKIGSPVKIVAISGAKTAKGTIKTTLPSPLAGLNFEVKLEPLDEGPNRGRIVELENGRQMLVWTKNPAVSSYLGKLNDDGTYANEHSPDTQAALAETIASIAADYVLRREVLNEPNMYRDVDMVIQKRTSLAHRYLKMLIEGLRGSQ